MLFFVIAAALLGLCLVFAWTTRDAIRGKAKPAAIGSARTLVSVSPWQSAEALAQVAVTAEEKEFARDAERLADHSVDQAFAAALRVANLAIQHRSVSGAAQPIKNRVLQLQQTVAQDEAAVKQLTAAQGSAKSTLPSLDSGDTDLDIAKAQLQLDSDELADASEDLQRAIGDERPEIQAELSAHEAVMKKYDNQAEEQAQFTALSVGRYHTLAGRVAAWNRQRTRAQMVAQAQQQAESDVRALTQMHNSLETSLAATPAQSGDVVQDRAARLAGLRNRSAESQLLSIYDDRIQTEQQLAGVYQKWAAQLQIQHRLVLHLILNSLAWVFAIVVCMIVSNMLILRLMDYPVLDARQRHTLRSIIELCIQLIGIGCILLVIFGPPRQIGTVLGLTTAALTVALQDIILAFFGWFVLMGKKGIRVGDTVEIDAVGGQVVEIGLMSTTLLETGTLAEPGYPTGRRISLLNSYAIKGKYFNFSTAGQWMWDHFNIAVPSSERTHLIAEDILAAVEQDTAEDVRLAERECSRARGAGLTNMQVHPSVNLRPSGNAFDVEVRYVTRASQRFQTRNRLYRIVSERLRTSAPDADQSTRNQSPAPAGS
jgi:small-conductance mechanosensitive channel